MVVVIKLGSQEYLGSRNARGLDALSDFLLVL
jgi:hypothetical protein